jgi:phospholipase C
MYVVSPWSKGGWVNSETFDHTSVGRFLEKRFDLTIPAISPWHRAMCGDLTSCFDFSLEGDRDFPPLPDASGSQTVLASHLQRPKILPPRAPQERFQEPGLRRSRALPYVLHTDLTGSADGITLHFINGGDAGATFHVYDRHHLDRLPRRYAVEAHKSLTDRWALGSQDAFDLLVLGPNGFMRAFTGNGTGSLPRLVARYDNEGKALTLSLANPDAEAIDLTVGEDRYGVNQAQSFRLSDGKPARLRWSVGASHGWYDFALAAKGGIMRLAGRVENGEHGVSDPLLRA